MKVGDWNRALAFGALDVDSGIEGRESYIHIGGVGGNARFAGTQYGVNAIEAFDGSTAAIWVALVALGEGGVAEVVAPGTLKEIAACSGHVTELGGSSAE